jgi:hypothetical protein
MSTVGPEGRSFATITLADLSRLAEIAAEDRTQFFSNHPDWAELYADRYIATALCQGAGLHYLTGSVGIHDFDVYSFFAKHPAREWYAKRNRPVDFGDPKFGRSPNRPEYVGRRVDLMGRGIECQLGSDPASCIRNWLSAGKTASAKLLAHKAVVLLDPAPYRGRVIWPTNVGERSE